MKYINKKISAVAIAAIAILLLPIGATAQLQYNSDGSVDGFIRNTWIEAGFNYNGSFGSYFAAPADYHPKLGGTPPGSYGSGTDRFKTLGFVADPNGTGWTDYYGDFFLPSTPYEGFSIRVEIDPIKNTGSGLSTSYVKTFRNDRDSKYNTPGIIATPGLEYDASRPHEIKWTGTATWDTGVSTESGTISGDVEVVNTHTIVDKRIENKVSITNHGDLTMTVYIARSVDPDNVAPKGSGHTTTNKVESQGDGAGRYSWVSAAAVDGSSVAYYTREPNAKVGIASTFGNIVDNPQYLWRSTAYSGWTIAENVAIEQDYEIGIGFIMEDLLPGETREVTYDIILDQLPVVKFLGSSSRSQSEGTTFTFDLERSYYLEKEVTAVVNLTKVSSGINTSDFVGLDAIPKSYTFVFAPGETSKSFSLETAYDVLTEGNESFKVEITSVTSEVGGLAVTPKTIQCTIIDIPLPVPSIVSSPSPIDEDSSSPALIKINLDRVPVAEVGGNFIADLTIGGTADINVDYAIVTGTNIVPYGGGYRITIPVGQSSADFLLQPVPDIILEGEETVTFTLTIVQGGRLASGVSLQETLIINDKTDGTIIVETVAPSSGDAKENPLTHGAFKIGFKDPLVISDKDILIDYTLEGTSVSGRDHIVSPSETTATIVAGENDVLIPITVIPNYIVQESHDITITIDAVEIQ